MVLEPAFITGCDFWDGVKGHDGGSKYSYIRGDGICILVFLHCVHVLAGWVCCITRLSWSWGTMGVWSAAIMNQSSEKRKSI